MIKSFLLEMMISTVIFLIPMKKRKWYGLKFLLVMMVAFFVTADYRFSQTNELLFYAIGITKKLNILPLVLYYGIHIVFLIAAVLVTVEADLIEAIFVFSMAYATEHIAYCIRVLVNHYSGGLISDKDTILYILAHGLVSLLAYFWLARRMTKNGHYRIDAITSIWTGFFVIFLVLILSIVSAVNGFRYIHGVYASMACILLLSMERGQVIARVEEEEFALREKIWEQKRMQYEISKDAMAVVNRNYHDIKHQIAAVNAMTSEEHRQEALRKMEENIGIYDSVVHTENELLDTVLTEKRLACERESITMSCICDGKVLLFMDGLDLYTLLGNALDNAIEATVKVPKNERFISVKIQKKLGMTMVEISNPIASYPSIKEGKLFTTKQDSNAHGYGIGSMEEIVKKYDGIFDYNVFEKNFVVRMIFQK